MFHEMTLKLYVKEKFHSVSFPLQILTTNSLNVKHQGKSSNKLAFHLSGYTHLFKERYFRRIQSTSWLFENSEPDPYHKNDMKEKVNDLVKFHEAKQQKLKTASYSEQIQIRTLVHDKWSRMNSSKYFNVFEYLVWTSHQIKKVGGICAKPVPKKGKTIPTETLDLVTNAYEADVYECLLLPLE